MAYIWPLVLVALSNVVYQIAAKSTPSGVDPLASLTVTYLVGAVASGVLYFILNKDPNLIREYSGINIMPLLLGLSVVGLEVGTIYAYRAGWPVSSFSIVQSAFLALMLIFVGMLLYKEAITWNKVIGIGICLVGLYFINK